jgi:ABC-type bacteriocin/lantibiotic exporter with double-glycine peptidase domain
MKRRIVVRQRDTRDCGAACLASVAAFYRLFLPVSRIRQYAGTDNRGTTVAGMLEAAEQMGFLAKGVKGAMDSLRHIPLPAIVHVQKGTGYHHYLVLYRAGRRLLLMDPADGALVRERREDFARRWTGVMILLLPGPAFRAGNERRSTGRRFWELVYPHAGVMIQAAVGAVVYTVLGLSTSVYLQKIVDHVLTAGNTRLLNLLGCLMIGVLLFQFLIGHVRNVFVLRTGQQIDAGLVLGYYRHLLRLPQRFFDTMQVGEILSRINDAVRIRLFVNDIALNLLLHSLVVIFSLSLMFIYYWKLALVTSLVIPLYTLIAYLGNLTHRRWQRRLMEEQAALEAELVDSLGIITTIRRFGLEAEAMERVEQRFLQLLRSAYGAGLRTIWYGQTSDLLTRVATVLLLWIGSYHVLARELSPGALLSFYSLLGYFTGSAMQLSGAGKGVQEALIAADRLYEIVDMETEVDHEEAIMLTSGEAGDIVFRDVHFRYGPRHDVFRGLNLEIPKGMYVAIVGGSGCGKSTIPALLQRLYLPSQGTITIGSHDIRDISAASLRRSVMVVPQEATLFAGSIAANIAAGDPEPDLRKIARIAEMLGIHHFVEALPDRYFTLLRSGGNNLSGGQRQLLCIARALYCEPEILILDEVTAALDAATEVRVMHAIDRYRAEGRTVIVLAHRLKTVTSCNRIFVLHGGAVAEAGTHETLLRVEGLYAALWRDYQGNIS